MDAILLMIIPFLGYLIAYHTYGKFIAARIFKLNYERTTPAEMFQDGIDFVPTKKGIIFGHHYTSIAGTGPIVGPAIGIIWGWLPALIWVFVGSIFMGAVHDFGALIISLRNEGKSVADITRKYLGPRVCYLFYAIIFLALLIVIAIFGLVIAIVFKLFPDAVFPVWMEIPIALGFGYAIYKRKGNIFRSTIIAVVLMYIAVLIGHYFRFSMPAILGIPATGVWTIILLAYAFIASILPVNTLLQPRDYINAWQLFVAMFLLVLGILASGLFSNLEIVAPMINLTPKGAPPIMPFLFITIACGAISGFHALISSGTTSKQIARKKDALYVGYGSMLLESVLAVIVIVAVSAGIGMAYQTASGTVLTGFSAWNTHYASWIASQGLGSKINAVVIGAANMIATLGIPKYLAIVILGTFIASFAGTTLDSACRVQRYVITELFRDTKFKVLCNKYIATAIAVLSAALLAFSTGAHGKGALTLWPLFGSVNQLLACLTLLLLTNYLKKKGGLRYLATAIPFAIMLVITLWAVISNQLNYLAKSNHILTTVNSIILIFALWIITEGLISLNSTHSPN